MEQRIIHFLYCPFTGLGLHNGFRGNKWLKNRIQIFKQFVLPSLGHQTNKNFVLWISWRPEEKNNPDVKELISYLEMIYGSMFKTIHTFHGVCFWDDKYSDKEARNRLATSLHGTMSDMVNFTGESEQDSVYMTIQPSDDCYHKNAVKAIQETFKQNPNLQALGFSKGYIMNYLTKEVAEYNPTTNPPFYTLKFVRSVFIDPSKHLEYTSLKRDVGQYKKGTPLPSHEYVKDCLNYGVIEERGFLVGTHGVNISTTFNIPFKGQVVSPDILKDFGLQYAGPLQLALPLLHRLPYKIHRKLRYWFGL